jgi:uncharacterized damage-inducible protein DinB
MNLDYCRTLFAYDDWATERVMDAAGQLDAKAYTHDFGLAWGSVGGTLSHIVEAQWIWLNRWKGNPPPAMPESEGDLGVNALRPVWQHVIAERDAYVDPLSEADLYASISYQNSKGESFSTPLWGMAAHVVNHGTDHRSHISIMLTELGHPPQGLDFITFLREEI